MPTVAKKKSQPKIAKKLSDAKLEKLGQDALEKFQAESLARFEKAQKFVELQDADTRDALDRMISLLEDIARPSILVRPENDRKHGITVLLPKETITHNATWMAVEILKDLGSMDVRVASFKFPKDLCATCHDPIKPKKKRKS